MMSVAVENGLGICEAVWNVGGAMRATNGQEDDRLR